jgi:hypothetical protein
MIADRHQRCRLQAPGFHRGNFFEIGGKFVRLESFDVHLDQADEGTTEIRFVLAAAIDNHAGRGNDSAVRPDNIDCFLDTAAPRHHIFSYDKAFAFFYFESPTQNESTRFFFGENVTLSQRSSNFLADDNSAQRRRDDRVAIEFAQPIGQHSANTGGDVGILKKQRALEILPAVQTGTQNEMPVEQRAGFAKKSEQIFAH